MSRSIIEEEGFTAYRKQTVVVAFLGENGAPKDCVAEELIKGGGGKSQYYRFTVTFVLIKKVILLRIYIPVLSCSSVIASWISTPKDTGSNLLKTFFKKIINIFTILKAPGSNPLNIYLIMMNTEAKANCHTLIYNTVYPNSTVI